MLKNNHDFTKVTLEELDKYIAIKATEEAEAAEQAKNNKTAPATKLNLDERLDERKKQAEERAKYRALTIEINDNDISDFIAVLQNTQSPVQHLQLFIKLSNKATPIEKSFEKLSTFLSADTRLQSLSIHKVGGNDYTSYWGELTLAKCLTTNQTLQLLQIECAAAPTEKECLELLPQPMLAPRAPFFFHLTFHPNGRVPTYINPFLKNFNYRWLSWLTDIENLAKPSLNSAEIQDIYIWLSRVHILYDAPEQRTKQSELLSNLSMVLIAAKLCNLLSSLRAADTEHGYPLALMIKYHQLKGNNSVSGRLEEFARKESLSLHEQHELEHAFQSLLHEIQASILRIYSEAASKGYVLANQWLGEYYQNYPYGLSEEERQSWNKSNPTMWCSSHATAAACYLKGGEPLEEELRVLCSKLVNAAHFIAGEQPKDNANLPEWDGLWQRLEDKIKQPYVDEHLYSVYLYTQMMVEISLLSQTAKPSIEDEYARLIKLSITFNALRNSMFEGNLPEIKNAIFLRLTAFITRHHLDGTNGKPVKLGADYLPLLNNNLGEITGDTINFNKVTHYWLQAQPKKNSPDENDGKIRDLLRLLKCFLAIHNHDKFLCLATYIETALSQLSQLQMAKKADASNNLMASISLNDSVLPDKTFNQSSTSDGPRLQKNWAAKLLAITPETLTRPEAETETAYLARIRHSLITLFDLAPKIKQNRY